MIVAPPLEPGLQHDDRAVRNDAEMRQMESMSHPEYRELVRTNGPEWRHSVIVVEPPPEHYGFELPTSWRNGPRMEHDHDLSEPQIAPYARTDWTVEPGGGWEHRIHYGKSRMDTTTPPKFLLTAATREGLHGALPTLRRPKSNKPRTRPSPSYSRMTSRTATDSPCRRPRLCCESRKPSPRPRLRPTMPANSPRPIRVIGAGDKRFRGNGKGSSRSGSVSPELSALRSLPGCPRANIRFTGGQLVRHRQAYEYQNADGKTIKSVEHRAGWDATFSAPKSISLTALVGGDEHIRDAHREAVTVALTELERYTQARIGGNNPAETTGQFVAAKFEHDTARPVDGYAAPQLHTHAVIFNVTERDNGQTRALQERGLFESQQFATAVYQSELTYRLRNLGYEIEAGRSGAPEIKGYTREYLDASSPRSQQIRERMEESGFYGHEAAEIAAHSTRDKKLIQVARRGAGRASPDRRRVRQPGRSHRGRGAGRGVRNKAWGVFPRERGRSRRRAVTFARDRSFEREAVTDERDLFRDALRARHE